MPIFGDSETIRYPCGCTVRWEYSLNSYSDEMYWRGLIEDQCADHAREMSR